MALPINIKELTAGGFRYVFFQTLYQERSPIYKQLASQAESSIQHVMNALHGTNDETNDGSNKMVEALNFLKAAASFERSQEIKFFSNFKNQFPEVGEIFNFSPTEGEDIDIAFLLSVNKLMKGTELFKKELNTELDRIQRQREADKLSRAGKQNTTEYFNTLTANNTKYNAGERENYYLTTDGRKTFESIFRNRSNLDEFTSIILTKFGAKLFNVSNGNIKLNGSQTSALIKLVIDKAYQLLIFEYGRIKPENDKNRTNEMEKIVESKELEQFINNLINSPDLITSLQSVADQHGINSKKIDELKDIQGQINNLKDKLYANYKKTVQNQSIEFEEWRKQNGMSDERLEEIVRSINTVKAQAYYTGEDMSLSELVTNHISAVLGGTANPTDDIQAGKLIIDFNISRDSTQIKNIEKAERQLLEKQREHFLKVNKTTTLDSFIHNTETLRELREQQNKILFALKNDINKSEAGLNYLLQHINIHTTVKGYISAGKDNFEYYGGFEGAAFGQNLVEELNIIQYMLETGGISMIDAKYLYSAMLNAGKLMIGAGNKHEIEDYFSAFIGFLMFNDAALMVQDVNDFIHNNFTSDSQDIHLYQLNGIYVPNSFILQKTYEALIKLPEASKSYGVRAKLHTYNQSPLKGKNMKERWEKTSEAAIESTELELKFLAGFLDLLENLTNSLPF